MKGGVFGFFAKRYYRVEVRFRPYTTVTPAPSAMNSPSAALDAMVNDTEDVYEAHVQRRGSFEEVLAGVASSLEKTRQRSRRTGIGSPNGATPEASPRRPEPRRSDRPAEGLRTLLDLRLNPTPA